MIIAQNLLQAIARVNRVSGEYKDKGFVVDYVEEDFERNVAKLGRTKTKAAEIEHAIRYHLDLKLDDDPDLKTSFAQALALNFEVPRLS